LATDDPYPAGDLTGKVFLIKRGLCTFDAKYQRAVAAGAAAVVIMNDGADPSRVGLFAGGGVTDRGVPGVTISFPDGTAIQGLSNATLTWTNMIVGAPDPTAGKISGFSSWGLDAHLNLKPEISAPGGNITSTWPMTQFGGHNTISGTSMASPHVAGTVADFMHAYKARTGRLPTFAEVAAAIENTAVPFNSLLGPVADSTARQGAGLVQVLNAINAPVSVTPSKISLGDGHTGPTSNGGVQTLTLTNRGASPVTYNLANQTTVTVDPFGGQYPFSFATFFATNVVSFKVGGAAATSVTVPAATAAGPGTATVDASIAPRQPDFWDDKAIYGGFVTFVPTSGSMQALRVPYGGFVGDYQTSITPIGSGGCNLPMLAQIGTDADKITCSGGNPAISGLIGLPTGGTFDQPSRNPVVLLYHLDHQVQDLSISLVDAATGQPVTQGGRNSLLFGDSLIPRNSTPTSFFAFVWDGTIAFADNGGGKLHRKAAPAGTYKLVLSVHKAKAFNDTRDNETQSWTSPAFTLRTP
jgi:hypothetical protein